MGGMKASSQETDGKKEELKTVVNLDVLHKESAKYLGRKIGEFLFIQIWFTKYITLKMGTN